MSLWRNVLGRAPICLVPRGASMVPIMRGYAEERDHNPPPICSDGKGTSCGSLNTCGDPRYEKPQPKSAADSFQFHHLFRSSADCCDDPCMERFPPFDQCYYKISDKAKRQYQVTWVECPPIQIKPKKICCFEKGMRPPTPRRKRKEFKSAECVVAPECPEGGACPKITLPGCKAVGDTKCHVARRIADCTKVKAPYPSYSECDRPKPRPLRRIECNCLAVPAQCDVLRVLKRREGSNYRDNCGSR